MTPIAIVTLVVALVIVWGGLVGSIIFLARRPNVDTYPPGGEEDARAEGAPVIRDT